MAVPIEQRERDGQQGHDTCASCKTAAGDHGDFLRGLDRSHILRAVHGEELEVALRILFKQGGLTLATREEVT